MSAGGGEEKILVSVRVRPLNEKEKTRNDRCDWECINNTTIICNAHNLSDKPSFTFDKVFGFECPTKQVYDDGAREVALCVLSGINSSIFAYGQTSSGKTYTMTGITGFAINDIFLYIDKHKQERKFTLKFSAMEIYNEAVRDLLCEDNNNPLRLLDDPERGTVVEKLKEETIRDRNHLEELISICETQRKIGETSLNETSSRSHQILRLTIESSKREVSPESSAILAASVCFVDLAGSERASQTLSAGSRLKEGCHINRSLLTLGTVIRKLSKGKHGHIPYRDSKLTRILQNSLGGNARTAIICTMSPARSHLEQSRNTLLFATCAKEVTTNAQVNMVVSEKALVKQLQRELMRMENELKNLGLGGSSSSTSDEFHSLLKQKEEVIEKMEEQIQELKWQRDVAQSRVENLLKSAAEYQSSSSSVDYSRRKSYDSTDFDEPRMLNNMMGQRTIQEPEDACKEVRCIEENNMGQNMPKDQQPCVVEYKQNYKSSMADEDEAKEYADSSLNVKLEAQDELTIDKLVEEVQETEKSVEKQRESSSKTEDMEQNLSKDQSCLENKKHYKSIISSDDEAIKSEKEDAGSSLSAKLEAKDELTVHNGRFTFNTSNNASFDLDNTLSTDAQSTKDTDTETSGGSFHEFMAGLKQMAMQHHSRHESDTEAEKTKPERDTKAEFERQQSQIIELWGVCNVPLVHRTYFFLLFKGDPSDFVYMEVELRRLSFLKDSPEIVRKQSAKTLGREREWLAKQIPKKFGRKDREEVYKKWGVELSSKQRSMQVTHKAWTKTKDVEHCKESASLVATLVGFDESNMTPKEMFGLSFSPTTTLNVKSSGWSFSNSFSRISLTGGL
ncbi:BnaA01g13640D [Brassica napus]|uniref:Kinesin-like protein n=1 Tax=Brassica napus TaxID=3708 RepID=A0A078H908_BRANA|nr:BnaA01g13640D [Brassica napus]